MKTPRQQEPRALRDELGSDDSDLALAARLLRSPLPPTLRPMAEKRVWARLHLRSGAARVTRAQVAAMALVLLGMMTVASATIGRRFIERALGLSGAMHVSAVSPATLPVVSVVPARAAVIPQPAAPGMVAAPGESDRARARTQPKAEPEPDRSHSSASGSGTRRGMPVEAGSAVATINPGPIPPVASPVTGPNGSRTPFELEDDAQEPAAAAPRSTAGDEENVLWADLLEVRSRHDLPRMVLLVKEHLARFPHGQLREEFLTVGIEAAIGSGDRGARDELARQYLDEFPTGLHRAQARRALDQRP